MKNSQIATIDDIVELKKSIINELKVILKVKQPTSKFSKSKDICSEFGISYGKLKKIRLKGLINAPRIGKEYYYSIEEINEKLSSGELSFND